MTGAVDLVLRHGYLALFGCVMMSQLGVPIPSTPLMLAVGATLGSAHRLSLPWILVAIVSAAVCADSVWYGLGRTRGPRVLRLLCRLSREPVSCVTRADGAIRRNGPRVLLVARFLPGLGLMMPPLVGQARVPFLRFLAFDATGASLWAVVYIGAGRALGGAIGRSGGPLVPVRGWESALFASALVVAVTVGVVRRYRHGRGRGPSETTF
jgi:membrane protein DedA with SNARE-associated domain